MSYDDTPPKPWTRPGFLIAATVVTLIVILGVIVAIRAATTHPTPAPTNAAQPSVTAEPVKPSSSPTADGEDSICRLEDVELAGTVTRAPETTWELLGISAVPRSTAAGPGTVSPSGMLSCFARTPEGAVFMAANASIQGSTPAVQDEWTQYVLAAGTGRDAALSEPQPTGGATGRIAIEGFRLMQYDGSTALVDVAVRVTSGANTVLGSVITPLIWENGDWKIVVGPTGDLLYDMAAIPDLTGYISWSGSAE